MKTLIILIALVATTAAQTLIGWNNLGMHCMDDDYSVFSILPPYNTIDAQFINSSGMLVRSGSGIAVTYEAIADPDGSINQSSTGLTGKKMPGAANQPQFLDFDGVMNWFQAEAVPIAPMDDAGHTQAYPLMRLTARSSSGTVPATVPARPRRRSLAPAG